MCQSREGAESEHWVSIQGDAGSAHLDFDDIGNDAWPMMCEEFVAAIRRGRSPELDARHGARLQAVLDEAARQVGPGTRQTSPRIGPVA
jgi:predicted dehydrogenase